MLRSIALLLCAIGLLINCSKKEKTGDQLFWSAGNKASKMLNQVLADSLQVTWSTGAHTSAPIPIGAIGPEEYTRQLQGVHQNTDFFPVINQALANRVRVIVVIGDGLGFSHMAFLLYRNIALQNPNRTFFERIMNEGVTGMCLNNQYGQIVTGSSEAATSIASGKKSRSGMVGLDADGYPTETMLDIAEKKQIPTGLITDTRLTHATPAGFFANIMDRGKETEIARQLAEEYEIEVLMGGGAAYFLPESTQVTDDSGFSGLNPELNCRSKRKDKLNLIQMMKDKGYAVVCTKTEHNRLDQQTDKMLGLFAGSEMNATIDRDDENTGEPSIPLMT
ncbi:MAG: alkaline phosphatase, partial [Candidatus Delongbacteria bacterium]|nr:alkaline phosphatase [Candidatus Delongbacteria bacterium]